MENRLRDAGILLAVGALAGCLALAGCGDQQLSKTEVDQIKKGAPASMPSEAQDAMKGMGKGGPSPGTPPRPAGQPGPGAPVGGH